MNTKAKGENPKVTSDLTTYEIRCLDTLLDELLIVDPDAEAAERCILSVLNVWQRKIKMQAMYPKKKNRITLDETVACALKAIINRDECTPTDPFHVTLLQILDEIQQVFFSPTFLIPRVPPALLQYSTTLNPYLPAHSTQTTF